MKVATDVGGTFTDLVYLDESGLRSVKANTTPPSYEQGLLSALGGGALPSGDVEFFAHGTTVVINALLTRSGARTALVTTAGFRDVLEIGRGTRPDLLSRGFVRPLPFVPRRLRFEVEERVDFQGRVSRALRDESLETLAEQLALANVEAVAICFLHAYLNPVHETMAASFLAERFPELSVVSSHSVCREWREYERTNTAVLSAYVHPLVESSLDSLSGALGSRRAKSELLVMQSNGGLATVSGALSNPLSMLESGPAAGVVGAAELGRQLGEPNILTLDIGGTTAKAALIADGEVRISSDLRVQRDRNSPGYPIRIPAVDLVEVGNGGGSVAWIDAGGRLHVGPVSAGALPGPVAYGKGGAAPTMTDANLLLGRINPGLFLGGARQPNMLAVERAFADLGEHLGDSPKGVARGVVRIANANMVAALERVAGGYGRAPGDLLLVAFGGGGGLHAATLAQELLMPKVIVPARSSVFSAWGMLMTDFRRDFVRTRVRNLSRLPVLSVAATFAAMEAEALQECWNEGTSLEDTSISRFADLRYKGRDHTLKVAFPSGEIDEGTLEEAINRFHLAHEEAFSCCLANQVELVNFHVVFTAKVERPVLPRVPRRGSEAAAVRTGRRVVDFDREGEQQTDTYDLEKFGPGMNVDGPAVIEDGTAAVLVPPQMKAGMDDFGNIRIEVQRT